MMNKDETIFHGHTVTLSHNETLAVLDTAEWRSNRKDGSVVVEILYQGKWLQLCRCDLFEQVHSYMSGSSCGMLDADPIGFYRERVLYGAKVYMEDVPGGPLVGFYVVDSTTDG